MTQNIWQKTFLDNPIVLRDLRSTMRGTRAFWFQGAYLFLLGVLAVTGYAMSTGQDLIGGITGHSTGQTFSIVDAQSKLQRFCYFIFLTLAGLITLIAPALTATSVSDERQRQSLDLLVTTPLSAPEMLLGKLMSSLAFLGLLLALSLPASALCVLLGGATFGDVFRVYALLAVDAVVLASIGLYFSCACKNSLQAVIWTYATVGTFVAGAFALFGWSVWGTNGSPVAVLQPLSVIGAMSPFAAVLPETGKMVALGAVKIPMTIALLPIAALTVRLFLTAATYRFGTYGAESGKSLRKQVLLVTGLATLIAGHSIIASSIGRMSEAYTPDIAKRMTEGLVYFQSPVCMIFAAFFALALPFLPGLFVPVRAEDAPPGDAQDAHAARDNGYFSIGAMLLPRHSGALPYFYTWLALAVGGLLAGIFVAIGRVDALTLRVVFLPTFYVASAGTLVWGLSRLSARFIRSASSARALAFGAFVLLNLLPALPLSLMNYEKPHPIFMLWLGGFVTFAKSPGSDNGTAMLAMVIAANAALITGMVMGLASKPRKE